MEFKVGQKVRVKNSFTFTKAVVGKVGIIKFIRDDGKTLAVEFEEPYILCHDCYGKCAPKRGLWFIAEDGDLELVPEPKFKVGDKVVYEGKRGKVYMVNKDFVHLRLDENEDIMYGCSDNLVEKLEDVQLQKGDTVKAINNKDGREITGEIGKVIDINGDCISVEFFNFIDGHSCGKLSKNYGHCWNMTRKNLEFLKREPAKNKEEVKIGFGLQEGNKYRYIGNNLENKYGRVCFLYSTNNRDWATIYFDESDENLWECNPEDLIEPDKDFEWKTGAVVKVVKEIDTYNEMHRGRSLLGKQGVIVEEESPLGNIGVAFYEDIQGHDCDGQGPANHCWRIKKKNLEYIGKESEENKMEFIKYDARAFAKNVVLRKTYTMNDIVGIYPNEEKRIVVVKFNDNEEAIRINCSADDNFDLTIAVALAIAYKNAGSKNKFKKKIAEKTKVIKSKPKKEVEFVTSADAGEEVTSSDLEQVAKEAFDNMFAESNKALNDFLNIGLTYGQRLYRARKEKKLNQADVAKLVGTVPSTISDWERGKYMPKQDKRKILEKVLGI